MLEKYSSIDIFIKDEEKTDVIEEEIADDVFEKQEQKTNKTESKMNGIILKFKSLEKKSKLLLSGSFILLLVSILIWLLFR